MTAGPGAPEVAVKLVETAEEREQVFRLRYETYAVTAPGVTAKADHASRRVADRYDERSELLAAYSGCQLIGCLRLTFGAASPFPDELAETYGIDSFVPVVPVAAMLVASRFAVSAAYRGTAVSFGLIAEGARLAVRRGVELVFCDCQPHLINLYARVGFRPYRRTYNDPQGGLVVPLVMVMNDGDHFRQAGSPLLGTVLSPDLPTSDLARRAASLLPATPPVRSPHPGKTNDWTSEIAAEHTGQALRVFENLDSAQLAEILARSHIIDITPGTYLIRAGQAARTMYVLLGGELEYRAGSRRLGSAQIGDVAGDVAFLLRRPRTIDVITGAAGARVLSLNEPALREVMESHSQAAAILLLNLCRMLAARVAARTEMP